MSNAPSKPVSFSRPKVGYFSNRPRICVDNRHPFAEVAPGQTVEVSRTVEGS